MVSATSSPTPRVIHEAMREKTSAMPLGCPERSASASTVRLISRATNRNTKKITRRSADWE